MTVVPVAQLRGSRMPEQGRIRIGVKTAKAMKAIDTFRFTSPDQEAIEELAALYGGTVAPWTDQKAKIKGQWEVITEANELRVVLPAESVTVGYEQWAGSGRARMCDGEMSVIPEQGDPVPCFCDAKGKLACDPKTRVKVILPDVRFGGVWRFESKGWNAFHELATMADLLTDLNANLGGSLEATMRLEKRVQPGKQYNVVTLSIGYSPDELLSGKATYAGPKVLEDIDTVPAIEASGAPQLAAVPDAPVDAVIVPEDPAEGPWAERADIPANTPVIYDRSSKVYRRKQ